MKHPGRRGHDHNRGVARTPVETLEGLKMAYPQPEGDLNQVVIE